MKKILEFLYSVWSDIYWYFKRFGRSVRNLYVWFPIIWKDRQFDQGYLINIQIKKLEEMLRWWESPKDKHIIDESVRKITSEIRLALTLMKKIYVEDFYELEYFDIVEKLYGKHGFEFVPYKGDSEFTEDGKKKMELLEMKTKWEKDYTPEEIEKIEEHSHELLRQSMEKNLKAKRILWTYIERHIDGWWD